MRKIGLLGGTFDPPHLGHLVIAEEVYQALELDEVWFIPTYEPPHKKNSDASTNHRIKMIEAAISDNDHFSMNLIEIDRLGKSYTFDTIKLLNEKDPRTEFYFIIGADMVENLPKWYKIEELVTIVQFVGVKREGYELSSQYPIKEVDVPEINISSTDVRNRLKQGSSVRYIIPQMVIDIIKEYELYGSK